MTAENAAMLTPGAGRLRALIIDHERSLTGLIASHLKREEFVVHVSHDGQDALEAARINDPDIVVLDLARRGLEGLEICRQLRTFSTAHVVMVIARDAGLDTVIGLSGGADDYIAEPFSPRELVTRIRAALRRPRAIELASGVGPGAAKPRRFGALHIDVTRRRVLLDRSEISLTRTEFELLAALSSRPGVAFTRRQLLEAVWGQSGTASTDAVDTHIGHLRRKLGETPDQPNFVRTVRGIGYRMDRAR
jgi:DNA-binding response OmpR family regulator